MCGENHSVTFTYLLCVGSPPRVRGKHTYKSLFGQWQRITPACAGKTSSRLFRISYHWDHPRVCGENHLKPHIYRQNLGSPPRVRGKPLLSIVYNTPIRITPACAGKTSKASLRTACTEDHPRVCGENTRPRHDARGQGGSPPRVRGKLRVDAVLFYRPGITPACAGKTVKDQCRRL